jgi:hypothetical protein
LLALALAAIAFKSSPLKRTGTIRPIAVPFGSFGGPTFLDFFCCSKISKLLSDGSTHSGHCRIDWTYMQNCYMPSWVFGIVGIVRPRINHFGRGMPDQIENFDVSAGQHPNGDASRRSTG